LGFGRDPGKAGDFCASSHDDMLLSENVRLME
jgi:hypothetical protein